MEGLERDLALARVVTLSEIKMDGLERALRMVPLSKIKQRLQLPKLISPKNNGTPQ